MTKNAKQSDCVLDESTSTPDAKDEANHITEPTVAGLEKVAKNRKKSDCNVHHVLRALNTLTTPEEKLAAMCQKYADLFDENRKLQVRSPQVDPCLVNSNHFNKILFSL